MLNLNSDPFRYIGAVVKIDKNIGPPLANFRDHLCSKGEKPARFSTYYSIFL